MILSMAKERFCHVFDNQFCPVWKSPFFAGIANGIFFTPFFSKFGEECDESSNISDNVRTLDFLRKSIFFFWKKNLIFGIIG